MPSIRTPTSTIRRLVPILGLAVALATPASAQHPGAGASHGRQKTGGLHRINWVRAGVTAGAGASHGRQKTGLPAVESGADVLEQARTAAFELGMEQEAAPPRQRSLPRMMTGLTLAVVGSRLVWYRIEDKDCREPEGTRCAWAGGAGAAGLAVGVLLMTVLATAPAARSVNVEPQPGGAAIRATVGF